MEPFNYSILSSLVAHKLRVIILPLNKKFTDLKEYSHLKKKPFYVKGYGKHAFYKIFDEVRGWGGNPVVIGEEWVQAKDKHLFNVVIHEIAHKVQAVLPKQIQDKIHKAYLKAKKTGYIRKNSSLCDGEYFADGVTFYFNNFRSRRLVGYSDMDRIYNRKTLIKKDKKLYDLIREIFGKS